MKIRLLFIVGFMLVQVLFISCKKNIKGVGPVSVHKREVSGFTKVDLMIPANVTIVVADSFNCAITSQDNIATAIKLEVDGEQLGISSDYSLNDSRIEILISLPLVEGLSISGAGEIKTLNIIKSESLKLYINGSGNLFVNAETDKLKTEINGSGDCNLRGSTREFKCEINGSGDLHGFNFSAIEAKVEINGSGDAELSPTDQLDAAIHGSGNITYKGSPHLKSEIVGSGEIKKSE